jgi:acetyltransferase-like isoleucine patch superfamily enzyme
MDNKFDATGWYFERIFRYRNKFNIFIFNSFIHLIGKIKGVRTGKNVVFNGFPVFRRYENSQIVIGNKCLFNSARNSVRVGLDRRCTFVTLRKGAEIEIGECSGGSGITILAAKKITLGKNVMVGAHTMIIDNDFHHADPNRRHEMADIPARPIVIEDNVFIGTNCMILKGVTIGENSVIGANSVVLNSLPKNSIAIGNPCKVVIIKKWDAEAK